MRQDVKPHYAGDATPIDVGPGERVKLSAWSAAADVPWFTLRLEVTRQTA